MRRSGNITLNNYTNGSTSVNRPEWKPQDVGVNNVKNYAFANFTQIGAAVSLDGILEYEFDNIKTDLGLTCPTQSGQPRDDNIGCWFGGYDYGLIGYLPVIEEKDSSGNTVQYTGHFPVVNEIFSTINDKGFTCSIEIIGQPDTSLEPPEEAGQIWLRAWYYEDTGSCDEDCDFFVNIDRDADNIFANVAESPDDSRAPDWSYCALTGIAYVARGHSVEQSQQNPNAPTINVNPWTFEPKELISSYEIIKALTNSSVIEIMCLLFLIMGCGCGIAIKLISCCMNSVKRNGYSKVKTVQYFTDSDTV